MRLNRLNSRDRLRPGDILSIPSTGKSADNRTANSAQAQKTPPPSPVVPATKNLAAQAPAAASKATTGAKSATATASAPAAKTAASPSFLTPTPAPAAAPAPAPATLSAPSKGHEMQSYVVSAGENEQTIAETLGISKQQLYSYNRLDSTSSLRPGDEIMVPVKR